MYEERDGIGWSKKVPFWGSLNQCSGSVRTNISMYGTGRNAVAFLPLEVDYFTQKNKKIHRKIHTCFITQQLTNEKSNKHKHK
jgi:hypothetical protein